MATVTMKSLTKTFEGNVIAVNDFNLEIEDKEFIVLVGPSGCGKTTTLRMVAGLEEITSGEIYIDKKLMNNVAPKDRDIAMVFQNYALYPHMTVYDNMAFGLKLRKMPKAEINTRVQEAAAILGITPLLERKPKALSGGQRQRVALGRAIVREPKVFLMDEPLSNLDAKLRVQMRTEITKLHQKLATTFIYVTHDQTEAMTMGTRIVVMRDGLIHQVDSPQNLYDWPNNVFVGGFIGTPPMNFFEKVMLQKEGSDVYAIVNNTKLKVPKERVDLIKDKSHIGKEVYMGIRPENIHDEPPLVKEFSDAVIEAKVEVVELMGSETYLYLKIGDKKENINARVEPKSTSKAGDVIKVALDMSAVHFFDAETETSLMK